MNEFIIGGIAVATAGHDTGKYYVIIKIDKEYLYLVDGKIRTLDRPKKKKMKHACMQASLDPELIQKIKDNTLKNEEIKRALKLFNSKNNDSNESM